MSLSELPPAFVVGAVQEALMTPAWLEAVTRRIPLNVSPIARNQRTYRERNPSAFCLCMFALRSRESDPAVDAVRPRVFSYTPAEHDRGWREVRQAVLDSIRVHRRLSEDQTVETVDGSSAPTQTLSRQSRTRLTIRAPPVVVFGRWVTPEDSEVDLLHFALLN